MKHVLTLGIAEALEMIQEYSEDDFLFVLFERYGVDRLQKYVNDLSDNVPEDAELLAILKREVIEFYDKEFGVEQ